ncbi:MAG: alanine racemase [Pseudomonadota bacterium]
MTQSIVEIDLSAIVHNYGEAKRLAGNGVLLYPVIKADAYGHGIVPVGQTLQEAGADGFVIASVEEAIALRIAGIKQPIVLHVPEPRDYIDIIEYGITPVIFDLEIAEILAKESVRRNKPIAVYLKVETGMGRLGIPLSDLPRALSRVAEKGLEILGLMSHLASADTDREFTGAQIGRLAEAIDLGRRMGFQLSRNHIANSAGLVGYKTARMELVRPGIMLYGIPPSLIIEDSISLKPAMTLKSRIIQVSAVPEGTPVSYGCRYRTPGASRIATIPVGYENGYNRLLSNRGEVLVRGKRARVVGTVCMCLTMIDITHVEDAVAGDEVVLFGSQGKEEIHITEVAAWANTISYEVLCSVGRHNKRFIKYRPTGNNSPVRPGSME